MLKKEVSVRRHIMMSLSIALSMSFVPIYITTNFITLIKRSQFHASLAQMMISLTAFNGL